MTTKQMIDIFYKGPGPETSFGSVGSKGPLPLDLCSLEKYMFTHTFFETICKANVKELESEPVSTEMELIIPVSAKMELIIPVSAKMELIIPVPTKMDPVKKDLIIPVSAKIPVKTRFRSYLKDSLFWCMYVHSHGQTVFETQKTIGTNMLNLMMTEKRIMSDFFNKEDNKTALKLSNHKITNIKINEIKCDLMTKPMLSSIESLIPCCVYWNCPIYVDLGDKIFLHFVPNTYVSDDDTTSDPNAVLLYMVEGRFELEMDQEKKTTQISEMRTGNWHKIQHYEKPLLGISTYKTEELQGIYDNIFVNVVNEKKMKKQDYYGAIAEKCARKIIAQTML